MSTLNVTQIRDNLCEAINRVAYKGERIIVRRSGKDVVAMIPIQDLVLLEELEDRIDVEEAEKALAESDERIPYGEVRRELGL